MGDLNPEKYYVENVGLVHNVASRMYPRVVAVAPSWQYDDLFQELTIIFFRACVGFDPTKGVKFSSYFTQSCYWEINRKLAMLERENVVRVRETTDETFIESLMDGAGTPEEEVIATDLAGHLTDGMSRMAKQIVNLCLEPTDWLEEAMGSAEITARRVGRLLAERGAPKLEIRNALREIETLRHAV